MVLTVEPVRTLAFAAARAARAAANVLTRAGERAWRDIPVEALRLLIVRASCDAKTAASVLLNAHPNGWDAIVRSPDDLRSLAQAAARVLFVTPPERWEALDRDAQSAIAAAALQQNARLTGKSGKEMIARICAVAPETLIAAISERSPMRCCTMRRCVRRRMRRHRARA
jgi:methenyltetrahydromethanopterin cyclohydrolase